MDRATSSRGQFEKVLAKRCAPFANSMNLRRMLTDTPTGREDAGRMCVDIQLL